jgi:hypothetical protein
MNMNSQQGGCVDFCSPTRNRYFYGKMLDVFHFELEQNYFNAKRWLLNRLVTGYGVMCGLNVLLNQDKKSITITPGVALDKCGHEIIVCKPTCSIVLPVPPPAPAPAPAPPAPPAAGGDPAAAGAPAAPATPPTVPTGNGGSTPATGNGTENCDCGQYVHVVLCYKECPADPVPSLAGDCDTGAMCSPGAIHERYCVELVDDKLPAARTTSAIPDLFNGGTINYPALANYVASLAPNDPCPDCCIPLANILIPAAGQGYDQGNIDISCRPLVYTLDMLYEMILAMKQGPVSTTARKP